MFGPPEEYDDDDDPYEGFSFGNEFDEDYDHNSRSNTNKSTIKYQKAQVTPEQYRDERFLASISEGNQNNLIRLLNLYCGGEAFNINEPLQQGFNLMLYACQYGRVKLVETLINFGADPNAGIDSTTPLIQVCKNTQNQMESYEIVQILLKCGVAINQSDRCGTTPLMYACANGNIEIVKHFIQFAALELADNQGHTALFHGVENNQVDVVRLLLDAGCQFQITNIAGYTPLHMAQFNKLEQIIALFPDDSKYTVPVEYLSNDHYSDLAPTAFEYDRKPAYFPDVYSLLGGMNSDDYLPQFAQAFIGLPEVLNITDERLCELGMTYPFQRKRIQLGLLKFHLRPWSPWTVRHTGVINYASMHDLYCLFACHLRHLIIMRESVRYVYININERAFGTVTPQAIQTNREVMKEVKTVVKTLHDLRKRIAYLEKFDTPKPPLLIEATRPSTSIFQSHFKITTLIGMAVGLVICWHRFH